MARIPKDNWKQKFRNRLVGGGTPRAFDSQRDDEANENNQPAEDIDQESSLKKGVDFLMNRNKLNKEKTSRFDPGLE